MVWKSIVPGILKVITPSGIFVFKTNIAQSYMLELVEYKKWLVK